MHFRYRRTNRRKHEPHHVPNERAFDPLTVAQDILDNNRTIVVYGDKIGVVLEEGKEVIYSGVETKRVITEFHEMFAIAKKCTLLCDPLRQKLQELLFICQPIGLAHARSREHQHNV